MEKFLRQNINIDGIFTINDFFWSKGNKNTRKIK